MLIDDWKVSVNKLLAIDDEMKLVSTDSLTVCKFKICHVGKMQKHSHPSEQITVVFNGSMRISFGGTEKIVSSGDVCVVPGNVEHEVEFLTVPFESIDIFSPRRDDFIEAIGRK